MRPDLDRIARFVVTLAVVVGGCGIGWGFWSSHEASVKSTEIETLVREHSHDLSIQEAENHALQGAVRYVEQSIEAICHSTYRVADCPPVPTLGP